MTKNDLKMNVHAEMMEKIKSWDRCKTCDGTGAGEGWSWILNKMYGILYVTHNIFTDGEI